MDRKSQINRIVQRLYRTVVEHNAEQTWPIERLMQFVNTNYMGQSYGDIRYADYKINQFIDEVFGRDKLNLQYCVPKPIEDSVEMFQNLDVWSDGAVFATPSTNMRRKTNRGIYDRSNIGQHKRHHDYDASEAFEDSKCQQPYKQTRANLLQYANADIDWEV